MSSNSSASSDTRLITQVDEEDSFENGQNFQPTSNRFYGATSDVASPRRRTTPLPLSRLPSILLSSDSRGTARTSLNDSMSSMMEFGNDSVRSNLTSAAPNRHHIDNDNERVYRAAADAGVSSFGIIAVDVWRLNDENGQLTHAALWVSPNFAQQNEDNDSLDRIIDPEHPNHAAPMPQVAGTGLAGYFLALGNLKAHNGGLLWRNVRAITSDPFQAPCPRMDALQEAGFGKAAGVAFNIEGHQGVVIYLARRTADESMLNEDANAQFLRMAAQHIGVSSALTKTRQESIAAKSKRAQASFRRLRVKQTVVNIFSKIPSERRSKQSSERAQFVTGSDRFSMMKDKDFGPRRSRLQRIVKRSIIMPMVAFRQKSYYWSVSTWDNVRHRVVSAAKKSRGSTVQPPPAVPWWNAMWTFVGVFCALSLLVCFGQFAFRIFGQGILLAPFGALLTLQFSLTAAPAAQPRAILYGQGLCLSIGVCCKYYLLERMHWPILLVQPLALALGITSMTKLGLAHPPAAAAMLAVFNQDDTSASLITAGIYMVANVLAICVSVMINNLSEQRQYPVYWAMDTGVLPVGWDAFQFCRKVSSKDDFLPY